MAKGQSSGTGQSMTGAQMKSRFRNPGGSRFDSGSFMQNMRVRPDSSTNATIPTTGVINSGGSNTPTPWNPGDLGNFRPMGIMKSGGSNTPTNGSSMDFSGPVGPAMRPQLPSGPTGIAQRLPDNGSSMDFAPIRPMGIATTGDNGNTPVGGGYVGGSSMDFAPLGLPQRQYPAYS